jgi:hypothetical protein
LGTSQIASGFRDLRNDEIAKLTHEDYLDWNQGVSLKNIVIWSKTLPIERLRGKVSFVPEDQNFGSFLQGSVKRISNPD